MSESEGAVISELGALANAQTSAQAEGERAPNARDAVRALRPSQIREVANAGFGVPDVLPWLALPLPANSSLVALPLVPRVERTVELVRRRDRSLSPAAESVWGLVAGLPKRVEELA